VEELEILSVHPGTSDGSGLPTGGAAAWGCAAVSARHDRCRKLAFSSSRSEAYRW